MAVGPAIALQLLGQGDFRRLFFVGGGLALAAGLLAFPIRHPVVRNPRFHLHLSSLFERKVGSIALTVFCIMFGYGSLTSFITLYAGQVGVGQPGLFFSAQAVGTVLARLWSGPLYDRHGPRWVVSSGLGFLALAYTGLALWRVPLGFFCAAFASGVGLSMAYPALQAMTVNAVSAPRRGAANATFLAAQDLGLAVGSFLLGLVAQTLHNYSGMYLVAGGSALLTAVLFYAVVLPHLGRIAIKA
jgi:MFS family permease